MSIIDNFKAINGKMPKSSKAWYYSKDKGSRPEVKARPDKPIGGSLGDVCYPPDDDRHYDRPK